MALAVKKRWWNCEAIGLGQERPDRILAETRSKARYSYWLDVHDVWPDIKITDIRVTVGSLPPVYEVPVKEKPMPTLKDRRVMSRADWLAEGERRFGKKAMDWRFKCVRCGEVQTMRQFVEAGMTPEQAQSRGFFSCIGRWVKGRGCDWTLGGLFSIHSLEVIDDEGKAHPVFEFDEVEVPA